MEHVQRELNTVEHLNIYNNFQASHVFGAVPGSEASVASPVICSGGIAKRDTVDTCCAYGEDVVYGKNGCLFVFDGHSGHETSYLAAKHSVKMFTDKHWRSHITKLLELNFVHVVESVLRVQISHLVQLTQNMLSGSTATWMQCFWSGSRRWVVTANMGDSEGMIITKKKVYMTTAEHNWDNLLAYHCYANHCLKYNLSPLAAIRITQKRSVYMLMSVKDNCVFRHLDVIKNMNAPSGGTQSVRRMVDENGTLKGHETDNWGAYGMDVRTGTMVAQTMLCLGDSNDKKVSGVDPHSMTVHIRELHPDEDVVLQVHSDGVGNIVWLHQLVDLYQNTTSSKECAEKLMEQIKCTPRDDMSFVLAKW